MKSPSAVLSLLLVLTLVSGVVSLFVGPVPGAEWGIIWQIRLPRVLLAVLVGFGLAGAGAVLQGVLRNPLADPFILGTSSAATAGVMVAGLLGLKRYSALYFLALGFALLSIFLVYRIAQTGGKTPVQTVILAGVIISLFFNAVVFVFFSVFYRESYTVLFYLLGTLTEGEPVRIAISGLIVGGGLVLTWFLSRELNLLTQGEEAAFHLGIRSSSVRYRHRRLRQRAGRALHLHPGQKLPAAFPAARRWLAGRTPSWLLRLLRGHRQPDWAVRFVTERAHESSGSVFETASGRGRPPGGGP
ncbi:MAG: FecCD family ABC transporter permease, partial [Acidobacteriota bacterium]